MRTQTRAQCSESCGHHAFSNTKTFQRHPKTDGYLHLAPRTATYFVLLPNMPSTPYTEGSQVKSCHRKLESCICQSYIIALHCQYLNPTKPVEIAAEPCHRACPHPRWHSCANIYLAPLHGEDHSNLFFRSSSATIASSTCTSAAETSSLLRSKFVRTTTGVTNSL